MNPRHIEDVPSDDEGVADPYDTATLAGTQPQRGPFEDFIV